MDDCLRWSVSHRWHSSLQLADRTARRPQHRGAGFYFALYCLSYRSTRQLSGIQDVEKRLMIKLNIAIGILTIVFCPLPVQASILLRIIDGDRVIARIQGKQTIIRLACIDAPEIGQIPHGRMARNTLSGLLPSHTPITIQAIKVERHGRLVANIFTPGGVNIGEELIRLGLVFVYAINSSDCDVPKLLLLEDQARRARIGLWKGSRQDITRPWLVR